MLVLRMLVAEEMYRDKIQQVAFGLVSKDNRRSSYVWVLIVALARLLAHPVHVKLLSDERV